MEVRQDADDSQEGSSEVSARNPVGNDLHWKNTEDCDTVGGSADDFQDVRKVKRLRGGRA